MKKCCEILTLIVIWTTTSAHGEYFLSPDYSSAIVRPGKFYDSPFDLIPDESSLSKRRPERLASTKRSPFGGAASSEEDDSRFVDYNDDSREFTIGTHIRVTHPTASLKKSRHSLPNDDNKSVSYSNINLSNESRPQKKKPIKYRNSYQSDPIKLITPPDSAEVSYSRQTFGPPRKAASHENAFRGVASRNQIERYLEDQQKLLDEAIKLQILNDPSRHAIGRYHQFLKAKDDERIEKEYEKELIRNKELFKPKAGFKGRRPRNFPDDRRPNSPGPVPIKNALRHYRSPRQPNKIVISI